MPSKQEMPRDWCHRLAREWEERINSPFCRYYIATIPGWDNDEQWEQQAKVDAAIILHGLEASFLYEARVLEIGCGIGRLAEQVLPRVRSYTGIDLSPSAVDSARKRCTARSAPRFFKTDGLTLPPEACDQKYELIFAMAVFIHLPKAVIASLVRSAFAQLEKGGEFRFQIMADPQDLEGIESIEVNEAVVKQFEKHEQKAPKEAFPLMEGDYYWMGEAFKYKEAARFMKENTKGEVRLIRVDPCHIYGWIKK